MSGFTSRTKLWLILPIICAGLGCSSSEPPQEQGDNKAAASASADTTSAEYKAKLDRRMSQGQQGQQAQPTQQADGGAQAQSQK